MKKRNALILLIILLINTAFMLVRDVLNLDELWNYNFARNISDGLLPYRDFNIIVTPLYPAIVAIFLKLIANELIVSRIIGILLFTGISFIAYKILEYLIDNKWLPIIAVLGILFVYRGEFWGDYNFAVLFITLLVIFLELKNNKGQILFLNAKYDFFVGILVGLAVLTKQTTGLILGFVFVIYKWFMIKNKQDFILAVKISLIRGLGVIIPFLAFAIYLIATNTFDYFIDYSIKGISTFSNSFPYRELLTHPDIDVMFKVIGGLIPIFIIINTSVFLKTKNMELAVLLVFSLGNMVVVYPLFDVGHSLIAALPLFIAFIYCLYLLIGKYINKPVNIILAIVAVLGMIAFTVYSIFTLVDYAKKANNNLKHLWGTSMSSGLYNYINNFATYINSQEESGKEVYVLSIDSVLPMIAADKYHKDYDMLTKGNFGSKGEDGLIEDVKQKNNSLFLIREEKSNNRQSTEKLRLFVENNFTKIRRSIWIWGVYKMKTIVIIPAHNEEQNIGKVIKELQNDLPDFDVVIVNDASTDGTKKIIEENNIKCIDLLYNMGYSMAVQTGIKYAYSNGYDYCIQMDSDGQHIAIEAKKLFDKASETDVDIVIGSRFMEKSAYKHGAMKKCGTKVLAGLIRITCHKKITDPTSGFQCINRKAMERFSKMGNYPEFPDANLIIELLLDGYKIEEVAVQMREREYGVSMHKGIIKPIKYMVKVLYTIVIVILRNIFGKTQRGGA